MRRARATLCCSAWASHCGGFSCCGARALGAWASVVVAHGLSCSVACGIFQTRARTRVPCIGRRILNHCATREAPVMDFKYHKIDGGRSGSYLVHSFIHPFIYWLRWVFVAVRGLLIAVASLLVDGLWGAWASVVVAHRPQSAGSVPVAYGLSCSAACGIFLDQGLNPCPLCWQVDC